MKRFGFGLLTAGMIAIATMLTTTAPAEARGGMGNGMIFFPPMGGGFGGGFGGGMGGGWHGPGNGIGGGWHRPVGNRWMQHPGPGNWHDGRPPIGNWGHKWGHGNHGWHGNPNWYHHGHWYGPRYPNRYPGYNWYYGGWWYPWPWWSNGFSLQIGDNYGSYGSGGGYSRHVKWCLNRYRSYNPRTDTYTGYDGRKHRCRAPY